MTAGRPFIAVTAGWRDGPAAHPGRRVVLEQGYLEAVRAAGALPLVLDPGLEPDELRALVGRASGLLLTGGEDVAPALYGQAPNGASDVSPERDRVEVGALDAALAAGLPVLAICRGIQLLDSHLGGTLWQDLPSEPGDDVGHDRVGPDASRPVHAIRIAAGSLLGEALGELPEAVNSSHHQGLRVVAPGLEASAWAGDGLVEAVERRGEDGRGPVLGVQWHPERLLGRPDGASRRLFAWFGREVRTAAGRRERTGSPPASAPAGVGGA